MAVLPLYFVRHIHVSTALTFRMLYSWLYEVLPGKCQSDYVASHMLRRVITDRHACLTLGIHI